MTQPAREKLRVLFVDDEPRILDGLKRLLHPLRKRWDTAFAVGGEAALRVLDEAAFDVIVTDMRMPGMDGAALLAAVRSRHPGVVRIILSGQTDVSTALRAVPAAQQFYSKPCDGQTLENAIERACALKSTLASARVRAAIGGLVALPSPPAVHQAVSELLARDDATAMEFAAVIEGDIALTAKLLQVANSSFFGARQGVTSARGACRKLGVGPIRMLLGSGDGLCGAPRSVEGFSLEQVRGEALESGTRVRASLPPGDQREAAFTAAVLRDVGRLALATVFPEEYERVIAAQAQTGAPLEALEREQLGADHVGAGTYLLGLWGLSAGVVASVFEPA